MLSLAASLYPHTYFYNYKVLPSRPSPLNKNTTEKLYFLRTMLYNVTIIRKEGEHGPSKHSGAGA